MLWDTSIQWTSNSEVKGSRTNNSSNETVEIRILVIISTVCLQIEHKRSQPVSRTLSTKSNSLVYQYVCNLYMTVANLSIKLMKGKPLRKHSLQEKTAASVLLKLFISSNE